MKESHTNRISSRDSSYDKVEFNNKFAVLEYHYPRGNVEYFNIGDYIQALASRQFSPAAEIFIDRDSMHLYKGDDVKMILNGWYLFSKEIGAPSEKIIPLLIAIHINSKGVLPSSLLDYFKHHEPVGCRDISTMVWLQKYGIRAYFSACMTLTLGKSYGNNGKRDSIVYFVDYHMGRNAHRLVDRKLRNILEPYRKNGYTFKSLTHIYPHKGMTTQKAFLEAEGLVRTYSRAALVVTSRIHCALPCLAVGTPVIFIPSELGDERYTGLLPLFNYIAMNGKSELEFSVRITEEGCVANSSAYMKYAERNIKTAETFIGEKFQPLRLNTESEIRLQQVFRDRIEVTSILFTRVFWEKLFSLNGIFYLICGIFRRFRRLWTCR